MFGIGCAVSAVAFIAIIISFAATSASSYALLFAGAQFDLFANAIPTSGLAIVSNTFAIASFLFSAAYFKTPMLCTPAVSYTHPDVYKRQVLYFRLLLVPLHIH